MSKFSRLTIFAVAVMSIFGAYASAGDTYDVAAFYWPSLHFDERWAEFFPDGSQGEWESIRNCKPKWEGHWQPRVPAWGYLMGNDPAAMEKKIDAATSHGVNVMIFDWYWFENKPFLESALNDGFLKAKNVDKMKFYLMWANHDAKTTWDIRLSHERVTIWPGSVDLPTFKTVVARVIKKYFSHPSYYKIDGKPVFSIYDMNNLIKGLGGVKETVEALDYFRAEVKKAGFPGLHIQMIYWARVPKIDDSGFASKKGTAANTIKMFKIDSLTNYQFVHLSRPVADYIKWADKAVSNWPKWSKEFDVPYFPHVSIGWDNNTRFVRKMGAVTDNVNPETFKKYLLKAKAYADAHPDQPKLITINAWNEWVEGSYLEPDERFGMGYLEAVKDVFVSSAKKQRPLVGVIRWDGYNGSDKWTQQQEFGFLKPEKYHWRAPWFVRRTGNPDKPLMFNPNFDKDIIQSVTDREIEYAADAGIDYFAFCHYGKHKGDGWQLRENLQAYLNSSVKSRVSFSLICIGKHVGAGLNKKQASEPNAAQSDWKAYVREYVDLIADSAYQRVHDGRALFYIFGPDALAEQLGDKKHSVENLKTAVAYLRDELKRNNLGNPYIVGMNAGGIWSAKYIDEAGLDAVLAYRGCFGATVEGTPYSQLSQNIQKHFLEKNQKREVIVPLLSGANHLPRHEARPKKFSAKHYLEPKRGELVGHIKFGLDWVEAHPEQCPARSVLIYAWNEHSEGGFLCPLMGEAPDYTPNTAQLDELAKALRQWSEISYKDTSAVTQKYSDGRPAATLRMNAKDHGIVLRYGDGPDECDVLGAREALIFKEKDVYHLFYDGAGPNGWLACLATSKDLIDWEKKGPVLDFGKPGEMDSAAACAPWVYKEGDEWHMFYLGTPNTTKPPGLIPSFPYLTMKAKASSLSGAWVKQKDVVPFRTKPNTYYSLTASPGHVVKNGDQFLQFFSSTTRKPGNKCVQRTLGIARTKDLDGTWTIDPKPMVPIEEQVENSSLYYEKSNKTWFLFTNHIGIDGGEYTDAVWVYWSRDLNKWDPKNKAVVLDGKNCKWSRKCIGMPSVIQVGKRLAIFYDAPGGNSTSHMKRNVGLAWLDLPLTEPKR